MADSKADTATSIFSMVSWDGAGLERDRGPIRLHRVSVKSRSSSQKSFFISSTVSSMKSGKSFFDENCMDLPAMERRASRNGIGRVLWFHRGTTLLSPPRNVRVFSFLSIVTELAMKCDICGSGLNALEIIP